MSDGEFDLESEYELLIQAHEQALQDMLDLLGDASRHAEGNRDSEMKVMDPLVRGQLQMMQLATRRELIAMKNFVHKLRLQRKNEPAS